MNNFIAYLKYRWLLLLFYIITVALLLCIAALSYSNMPAAWYTVLLISFVLLMMFCIDGARFKRKRKQFGLIKKDLAAISTLFAYLPKPGNTLEADYQTLLQASIRESKALQETLTETQNENLNYYTLWVHQIKTPIAAMRLILQNASGLPEVHTLQQELFSIERYIELALQYVRLKDISSDLVLENCDLNRLVKQSVKKYGLLFVCQKLSVEIGELKKDVVTDTKWFSFIFEQVLSNAIKYTKTGGVQIYMEAGELIVQDSGIGIRPEDLPRIFEEGYTGYNGRVDNRASGIGLYLSKRVADALAVRITVTSGLNRGTKVTFAFPEADGFHYM